ncbi:MAG: hypothetical protein O3C23_00985 [bacterium]|nr:hypothetical protein [bacterium]
MILYAVFLGAIVQFFGGVAYIKDTLKGQTKPNRVTWFLWMVAPYIGTAAAISDGVTWAILPVFMAGFVPMLVFLASFMNKNAYWKLGMFDYVCGASSVLALVLWALTQQPLVGIIFAIIADGLAALPTLVKTWKFPETETAAVYIASLFSVGTGFLAVQAWATSEYIFSLYLLFINCVIIFTIYRKKIMSRIVHTND